MEALYPGTYQYTFSHQLRHNLPPTYSCRYGTISYMCKARAISHDLFAFNGKSEFPFVVLPVLDLNAEPAQLRVSGARMSTPYNRWYFVFVLLLILCMCPYNYDTVCPYKYRYSVSV